MTTQDSIDTALEQLLEVVLVQHNVPAQLSADADRGDLASALADQVRALRSAQPLGGGQITHWRLGDVNPYATVTVEFGPFTAEIHCTSRQLRHLAVDVLAEQGPYLEFNPPNPQMRERANGVVGPTVNWRRAEPGWEKRADVRDLVIALRQLRERQGAETFGWALQVIADDESAS